MRVELPVRGERIGLFDVCHIIGPVGEGVGPGRNAILRRPDFYWFSGKF